jgi:hypothetical protein
MAILNSVPGLEICVCIDGEALVEYDDDEEQEVGAGHVAEYQAAKTVSKYIESISDKDFGIKATIGPKYVFDSSAVSFAIEIDGKLMITPILEKSKYPTLVFQSRVTGNIVSHTRGVRVPTAVNSEKALLKKFRFSKIEMSLSPILRKL